MEQYRFKPEHSEIIVKAIIEGYREYIEHRIDRRERMEISSAFAWTKGNFIESKIAEYFKEDDGEAFTHKKSKAGLTWDYLQFTHKDSKVLFLIKNAAYFNEKCFSRAKLPAGMNRKDALRTYLHDLSKINADLEFPTDSSYHELHQSEEVVQLSLPIPLHQVTRVKEEIKQLSSMYNEFHILTYAMDDAYQISRVKHYLPNPHDNIAYLIEDLSDLISGAELDDREREVLAPDSDGMLDPAAYDIEILEEERQG